MREATGAGDTRTERNATSDCAGPARSTGYGAAWFSALASGARGRRFESFYPDMPSRAAAACPATSWPIAGQRPIPMRQRLACPDFHSGRAGSSPVGGTHVLGEFRGTVRNRRRTPGPGDTQGFESSNLRHAQPIHVASRSVSAAGRACPTSRCRRFHSFTGQEGSRCRGDAVPVAGRWPNGRAPALQADDCGFDSRPLH